MVDLLGLQGDLRGFVNTVDIRPALKADEDIESVLPLGSVRQFIVKSVSANKKMVALTLDDKKLAVAALKNDDALTMQKFQAGALVNATVTTVLPTGLWLKVDVFEGSVDWNHSVGGCASVKDLSSYRVGQKVVVVDA